MDRDDTGMDWRAIQDRLRPFVARRVPRGDVDDVLQEILLRAHRGLARVLEDEKFSSWLFRVARNAIVDAFRSRGLHPLAHAEAESFGAVPSVSPVEPDDGFGERELAASIGPLVASLPPAYREAITLVELEGRTQAAAAQLAGVSVSGMKSRVQRGRSRLRKVVEGCCSVAFDGRGRVATVAPRSATDPDCCRSRPPVVAS